MVAHFMGKIWDKMGKIWDRLIGRKDNDLAIVLDLNHQ